MSILLFITAFFIFIGTISYAIYEIKNAHNLLGGISIIIIVTIGLFFPGIMSIIR